MNAHTFPWKRIRLCDVPEAPAYLVFHDAFDNGAMEVYPKQDLAAAETEAERHNRHLDEIGMDDAGFWKAYTKLPRVRVYRLYTGDHTPFERKAS